MSAAPVPALTPQSEREGFKAQFLAELKALKDKYEGLYAPLYEKVSPIVTTR
jgi:hypothetical protein